jgi:hypothetical protein
MALGIGFEEVAEERDSLGLALTLSVRAARAAADVVDPAALLIGAGQLHGVEEAAATVGPGVAEEVDDPLEGLLAEGLGILGVAELLGERGGVLEEIAAELVEGPWGLSWHHPHGVLRSPAEGGQSTRSYGLREGVEIFDLRRHRGALGLPRDEVAGVDECVEGALTIAADVDAHGVEARDLDHGREAVMQARGLVEVTDDLKGLARVEERRRGVLELEVDLADTAQHVDEVVARAAQPVA